VKLRAVFLVTLLVAALVILAVWVFAPSAFAAALRLFDDAVLEDLVLRAGFWGPVLVVVLMTVAIVASPLPSAPIAVAAGAAYGHVWGTVQVVLGAELGALIAFGLARMLGREAIQRMFGDQMDKGLLGSQTALTMTVFASRLMPFVSFDMMSYAAGLSNLQTWRFCLATFAGIIPASYVLAHVGEAATSGNMSRASWAVLGLGLVTGLPLVWIAIRGKSIKSADRDDDPHD